MMKRSLGDRPRAAPGATRGHHQRIPWRCRRPPW